jgi:aminoglycoside N3'-acetyltransferase
MWFAVKDCTGCVPGGHQARWQSAGYQHLLEADGSVLLMGVGIDRCSSLHQAERIGFPPEIARLSPVG